MAGFQKLTTLYPPEGSVGMLASESSARQPALPPQGSFIAGANGLFAGRFAWVDGTEPTWLNNAGTGKPLGVILNEGYGQVNVTEEGSLFILPGTQASCWTMIDIWVRPTSGAKIGDKAFAKLTDGTIQFAATGTDLEGYIETDFAAASGGAANTIVQMTRFGV